MDSIIDQFCIESSQSKYDICTGFSEKKYWNIDRDKYGQFWEAYCELVYNDDDPELSIHESIPENAPVIIDLCLHFNNTDKLLHSDDPPYTWKFILNVIQASQDIIIENFEVTKEDLECAVLISDKYSEDSEDHYFIRLQFPNIRINTSYQSTILIENIINRCYQKSIQNTLDIQSPTNNLNQMFYPINRCGFMNLYFSRWQDINEPLLEFTYVFPLISDPDTDSPEDISINDYRFLHSNHQFANYFDLNSLSNIEERKFWLPLYLSTHYGKDMSFKRPYFDSEEAKEKAEHLELLLPLIGNKRFHVECDWLAIGQAIKNTFKSSYYGLMLWYMSSEKYGYHYDQCKKLYDSFGLNHYSVKTIAWFASIDSKREYDEFINGWIENFYPISLSCTDQDVAKMFYPMFWLKFVCTHIRSNTWYVFEGHRWKISEEAVEVSKEITGKFINWYEHKIANVTTRIANSNNDTAKKEFEEEKKKIETLIKKLKSSSFECSMMRKLKVLFYQRDFTSILDTNDSLLGVLNGVIEVTDNDVFFRDGKPEDYINKNTNIPYDNSFHERHEIVLATRKYISQVFVDPHVREYFYRDSASLLKGKNSSKLFRVWNNNKGNNSKTMCVKLFTNTFGDYVKDLPTSVLTHPNFNASAASPEIADLIGSRVAFACEPEDGHKIRTGIVKRLTGGDRIRTRKLHENGGSIEAFFNIILVCNEIPEFDVIEDALDNRFRPVPFDSEWVNEPPESEEEQFRQRKFKKNIFFEKEIPDLAKGFLWLLVKYYPLYLKEKLEKVPEPMENSKRIYYNTRIIYNRYINERINLEAGDESRLTETNLYKDFEQWYRDGGGHISDKPMKKTVIDAVKKIIKNHKVGVTWIGCALKSVDSIL